LTFVKKDVEALDGAGRPYFLPQSLKLCRINRIALNLAIATVWQTECLTEDECGSLAA
jgi:hypothetical protein